MDFLNHWLLTILIFLPIGRRGAVLLCAKDRDAVRWTALGTTIVTFLLSLLLFATFDWNAGKRASQLRVRLTPTAHGAASCRWCSARKWIPAFNIEYKVGIDGLSSRSSSSARSSACCPASRRGTSTR